MDYIRGFFCVESSEMFDEYWRSKGWLWRENLYQYLEGEGGGIFYGHFMALNVLQLLTTSCLCSISAALGPKQSSGELSLLTNQEGHQRRPGSDWDLTCKWTFTISDSKLQTHTMLPQMWMSAGRWKTTNFFNKVKQLRNELFLLFYTLLFAEWCKVLLSCQLYFQA